MDIRFLKYFLAVAREQNVTKAARSLQVSQPTLSRQIMNLEEELGVTLFDRNGHNVKLTHEGFVFRRRAQELVTLAERTVNELAKTQDAISGRLAIGCGEIATVKELAGLIAGFQLKYPRVKFELYSGNNENIEEKLDEGSLDLGLFQEPFNASRYDFVRMKTVEQWGALIHKEHPLYEAESIKPGDLVGTMVVTIHINTSAHIPLVEWSGEHAKDMDFCANYNVLHNGVILAKERKGAVICLKPDCVYEDMKFLPLNPALEFGSLLAWRREHAPVVAFTKFVNYITDRYALHD